MLLMLMYALQLFPPCGIFAVLTHFIVTANLSDANVSEQHI